MDVKVEGQVWLFDDWLLLTDYRDYNRVLPVARQLNPLAKARAVAEDEIPPGAERVI